MGRGAEGGGSGPGWGPIFLRQQQWPRWISCRPGSHYGNGYGEACPPPSAAPSKGPLWVCGLLLNTVAAE